MQIEQRQVDVEEGKYPRFLINAQGMHSNEAFFIPLKRGPFSGLKPVEMWYQRPNSSSVHPAFDCLPQNITLIMVLCNVYNAVEVLMFPQFIPNEYLWKTHADKGKEKWEIYAWAVRDMWSKYFKKPVLDGVTVMDKIEYENLLEIGKTNYA